MTTGDELLLLAIVPGRRRIRIRAEDRLRFALRASELVDLGLAGRITVSPRQIEVTGSQSVEDRRLRNVLRSLSAAAPPPGLKDWLSRTPRSLTIEYLSRLEDQKAVRVRRWRAPGGRARHDILSVDLPRRRALLARLDNVVRSGSATPKAAHDISLAMLVQAAGLASAAYPGLQGIIDRRRLAALAASDHLTPATANAVLGDDAELAAALTTGAGALTRQLLGELSDLYADFTTGGHSLAHGLDPGSWSEGGTAGTGHHSGGHGNGSHGDW
ncbi:GPP34 family phosphoprotein [Streptomyces sp. NBC_00257]|uniref:GOLPH3/VPS74 family protein n=1 Tax=unclassified Streptomyces TaxID=2593676 RepID=UPI00224FCF5C|nr:MULTISPECIES: GPP34 family phosphoprotein [unclassified Streptomyces]MCX5426560.1 GPP34 family phosphoprotein [Streptomyces sp. NBC_00062]